MSATKIIVAGRLFEGLKEGLLEGRWTPKGVPAFVRMVEGLAQDPRVNLLTIIAAKDADPRFRHFREIYLPEVGHVKLLPWLALTGGKLRQLDRAVTELTHLISVVWIVLSWRAQLICATYAHVYTLAFVSRLGLAKTVLRVMGIFPHHRNLATKPGITGWCLRSPFELVVCSEDGSDPGIVLPPLLSPKTILDIRLNGCDATHMSRIERNSPKVCRIVFVGRLEPSKGCLEFVEAIEPLIADPHLAVEFHLIGDGSLLEALRNRTSEIASSDRFFLRGSLPHEEVIAFLTKSDIYVSGNWFGNLSNANLEAIAAGVAMVIPTADYDVPIDVTTDDVLPKDIVCRYDRMQPVASLRRVLLGLINDRSLLEAHQRATARLAKELLVPWPDRIASDIEQMLLLTRSNTQATNGSPDYASGVRRQ